MLQTVLRRSAVATRCCARKPARTRPSRWFRANSSATVNQAHGASVATQPQHFQTSQSTVTSDKQIVVDLVKRYDYESFLIGLCFPDHARSAFFALRAFSIELALAQANSRDNVLSAQIRLKFWSDTVDGLFSQGATEYQKTPVSKALSFAVHNNGVDRYWLDRMIRTREADILREDRVWSELEEVETFSEGVYSSMMYATADLLQGGCDDTETAMSHMGVAHGLMQMLLAVPGSISAGGYLGLPTSLFSKPLDPALNCADRDDVISAVHDVCVLIDSHLEAAKELAPKIPKANRPLMLQVRHRLDWVRQSRYSSRCWFVD